MDPKVLLEAVVLSSLAASVVSSVVLFVRPPSRHERPGTPRALRALLSLIPLASGPLVLALLGATAQAVAVSLVSLLVADVLWLRLTDAWNWRGHAAWAAATLLAVSWVGFMLVVSLEPGRGVVGTVGGLLLWVLELLVFTTGAAYLWEVFDVAARTRWDRRSAEGHVGTPTRYPFVSLHVPAHNEPPEMVIETLRSLLAIDYPAFEIVMVDDNSTDPSLWHPVRDFCRQQGIRFEHLEDWPGYKSGALNYVLAHATDPRAEIIGVIDADYIVDSDYLARCATLFADRADLGFVQTPQNYRQWEQSRYFRRLFFSYEYFFAVSQTSRNEVDGAIFGGTMGLIRRQALEQVGGWDEWCITEDAEVSLKMLRAGWQGQHVERAFGHGVMPLTFEALKRQRFRWCFGGMQILKAHWRSLLPWDRSPDNHLSQAQRWSYLAGGLQWFNDLLGMAFSGFLLLAAVDLALGGGLVLRRLGGMLLVLPPLLLLLGLMRALAALRLRSRASWRDAVGALSLWLALSMTVALACVRGLMLPEGVFLRTPKTREQPSLRDAVRANRKETGLGAALVTTAGVTAVQASLASSVLALLLLWHGLGLLAAPVNSVAAMHADLSAQLRRRRTTEWLRERVPVRRVSPRPLALGIIATACMGVAGLLLFGSATVPGTGPDGVLNGLRNGSADKATPRKIHEASGRSATSAGLATHNGSAPTPSPGSPTTQGLTSRTAAPSASVTTSPSGVATTTSPTPARPTAVSQPTALPTGSSTSPPTPTATATARPTPTATARPTATATARPTATPTPTRRPT